MAFGVVISVPGLQQHGKAAGTATALARRLLMNTAIARNPTSRR